MSDINQKLIKMKKYILALAIGSVVFMSAAMAQSAATAARPKMDPQAQTDKMAADLGLNADQKAKVLALNQDAEKKMEANRSSGADKDTQKAEGKKIRAQKEESLKAILTPDQFAKHQQAEADMKAKREQK
jgi:hypothetical protein